MTAEEEQHGVHCIECFKKVDTENERLGGAIFSVIVPSYNGSQRVKAGSIHRFQNRPAEKVSVNVPKKGIF